MRVVSLVAIFSAAAAAVVVTPACDNPIACQTNADCATDQVCRSDNFCGAPTSEPAAEPAGEPGAEPAGEPSAEPAGEPGAEPAGEPSAQPEPAAEPGAQPTPTPDVEPESACPSPPCFVLIDSATPRCHDEDGFVDDCPAEGSPVYGQDGNTLAPLPSYSFAGAHIRDDLNGLVWESGQTADLTHAEAEAHCAAFSDDGLVWRLPTLRELFTLLDFGADPTIQAGFPPPISNSSYHSKSRRTSSTWYGVDLDNAISTGSFSFDDEDEGAVKCVSGPDLGGADFVRVGAPADNIAMDVQTGIMLQLVPNPSDRWQDALGDCEDLSLAGFDDWHLATAKEAMLMLDPPEVSDDSRLHPFFTDRPVTVWTSSVVRSDVHWIDQDNGFFGISDSSSGFNSFRCARWSVAP